MTMFSSIREWIRGVEKMNLQLKTCVKYAALDYHCHILSNFDRISFHLFFFFIVRKFEKRKI